MEIDIQFDSFNKTFYKGSNISGSVIISCNERVQEYSSINVVLIGSYSIKNNKVNPPSVSIIKFYLKKIKISENGKLVLGNNNIFQFKFSLNDDSKDNQLYETYQGVLVSLGYELKVEIELLNKGTVSSENKKVFIFVPGQGINEEMKKKIIPYEFNIIPETIEKNKLTQTKMPKFRIKCKFDNTNCDLNNPFDGSIIVYESEIAIKSLELQFVRNESVILAGGETLNEISEIQNLQIGDGDVNRDVEIPLFMIFPRYFACACLQTKIAKISFEMNIIVVLVNGIVITENFPINTWRS
jgi:hypothetical protein